MQPLTLGRLCVGFLLLGVALGGFAHAAAGDNSAASFTPEANRCPERAEPVAIGSVQWNGKRITLTNPATLTLYAISIAKSVKVVGITHFRGWTNSYSGGWPYVQTWLQGTTFIAQSTENARLGFWNYPDGGAPAKRTAPFESGATTIYGVTVSAATARRAP